MLTLAIVSLAMVTLAISGHAASAKQKPAKDWDEFAELQRQIAASKNWNMPRLEKEALRREALIFASDKTPVDIALRRTSALLENIKGMKNAPDLSAEAAALNALKTECKALPQTSGSTETIQRAAFDKIAALRRKIAFKNPLLDFDRILFLKHNKQARGASHMLDQYMGFNASKSGGVYVLENAFSDHPAVRSLFKDSVVQDGRLKGRRLEDSGSFIALDLDYDAKSILFAFTEAEFKVPENASYKNQPWTSEEAQQYKSYGYYYFRPESTYHIFKANSDGSDLRQLTDGLWNEYDPVFLPNGRIAFLSERNGGACRCGERPLPSATLFSMMRDGGDIIQLSWHDTNEWHPSVDNNGMIVYTRWDYVDRDSDIAHHIWQCSPDGRDPRSYHGNYPDRREMRPWIEMDIRAIPDSTRYIAVATAHHGQNYGSLVMIDLSQPDDRAMSQVRRLTPEAHFPESELAPGQPHDKGKHSPLGEVYGTPWPLSEDYYLCVYDTQQKYYGIYLVDSFGNRELLYRDPQIACLDPMPLKPRLRPPTLPERTMQAKSEKPANAELSTGTVAVMNVYESEFPWPSGAKVRALRVVNLFPKPNAVMDDPRIGRAAQSLARGVLGTVPVEEDGSAHFVMPAGAPVYFQALDENGLALQTMRSDTYLHPGETLSCMGCHESKSSAAKSAGSEMPLAMRRAPSALVPEVEGSYPLTFARLVQPVLDRKCAECHDRNKKAPSLHGDRFGKFGWSEAFQSLQKYAWGKSGGNGAIMTEGRQYSVPGQDCARVSKLYTMLKQGHHEVKLAPEELRRITLWLDCNSNFYGAYRDKEKQAKGQIVKPEVGVPAWMEFEKLAQARK
ncbi:MAG: hypothetical protein NTX50_26095 [Candidatus Sumerlaeota bacterium]|nr:hypothetical protein [Candidatus Sumerlaeota bacterium]